MRKSTMYTLASYTTAIFIMAMFLPIMFIGWWFAGLAVVSAYVSLYIEKLGNWLGNNKLSATLNTKATEAREKEEAAKIKITETEEY